MNIKLKVGDQIWHLDTPGTIREIREVRETGYTWFYISVPDKDFLSENSSDPLFEGDWRLVPPTKEFAEAISKAGSVSMWDDYGSGACPFCEETHSNKGEKHHPECVVLKARTFLATDLHIAE